MALSFFPPALIAAQAREYLLLFIFVSSSSSSSYLSPKNCLPLENCEGGRFKYREMERLPFNSCPLLSPFLQCLKMLI